MQRSTSAIILSELDPVDDKVWIAEIDYDSDLPPNCVANPGSKYGLPGAKEKLSAQGQKLKQTQNLQVIMAKTKVSYQRIFPLYEVKHSLWQLDGHKLSAENLEMLNRDIGVSSTVVR